MTTPESHFENPFDQTIWDPIDPEQAIEDPLHGAEAAAGLLSIPPFRNEDGTYYVFGGSYAFGTCNYDADGRPFVKVGSTNSMLDLMREIRNHGDWVDKHYAGELPSIEEMGYPNFRFGDPPYFVFDQ